MWWTLAAAALPYVMSAMQDKPNAPSGPAQVVSPDRSVYVNQVLDSAFNPNNKAWLAASENSMDQVNRQLGRRGMLGSSLGQQMQANTQATIAKQWLDNKTQREQAALTAVGNYDHGVTAVAQDNARMKYEADMNAYKDAVQRNANQVQGVSNMVNTGIGAYNQDQYQKRLDAYYGVQPSSSTGQLYVGGAQPQGNYAPAYQTLPASNNDPYYVGNA